MVTGKVLPHSAWETNNLKAKGFFPPKLGPSQSRVPSLLRWPPAAVSCSL